MNDILDLYSHNSPCFLWVSISIQQDTLWPMKWSRLNNITETWLTQWCGTFSFIFGLCFSWFETLYDDYYFTSLLDKHRNVCVEVNISSGRANHNITGESYIIRIQCKSTLDHMALVITTNGHHTFQKSNVFFRIVRTQTARLVNRRH